MTDSQELQAHSSRYIHTQSSVHTHDTYKYILTHKHSQKIFLEAVSSYLDLFDGVVGFD